LLLAQGRARRTSWPAPTAVPITDARYGSSARVTCAGGHGAACSVLVEQPDRYLPLARRRSNAARPRSPIE